jgi:hypothetical protein
MLEDHPDGLENFDRIQEPAYSAQLLQGGHSEFSEDDHSFSLEIGGSMHKKHPRLDAEEDANQRQANHERLNEYDSLSGITSEAPSIHEQITPMSLASSFHHEADATKLQETITGAKAHSLSKKMNHIYY